ncbi:hypothetical protein SLEP1_g40881 [Rubroshorea leprosula]|uniref:Transposase MuDR plant domain-containing protein n=1 Tax=Rubroshorea leprosula TaxID=152421 RepID=A0AAV5L572_9ROSI|nr:hypothetical protein SLEP1_g40881 [Rubroshorea leprosula]
MADKEVYGGVDHMDFFKVGNSGAGCVTQEIMQDGGEYVEEIDAASGAENDAEGSGKHVEQFYLLKRKGKSQKESRKEEGENKKGKVAATSSNIENHHEEQDRREIHSGSDDDDLSAESDDSEDELYIPSDDPGDYFDQSNDDSNDEDEPRITKSSDVWFDPTVKKVSFEVGMKFEDCAQFKHALDRYKVQQGCKLKWSKNEPMRERVLCTVFSTPLFHGGS